MKFTCTIDINCDRKKVAEIFSNPDNLKHFQEGFKSFEYLEGIPGQKGATKRLVYEKLELIETILVNNLPDEFMALYEHKHMTNTMRVEFIDLGDHKTRYNSEIHYTKFNGVFIKIIAKLFPGMFKKQVLKWMHLFKDYVENQ
jgi:uncharacterized membrane protein